MTLFIVAYKDKIRTGLITPNTPPPPSCEFGNLINPFELYNLLELLRQMLSGRLNDIYRQIIHNPKNKYSNQKLQRCWA